MTYAGMCVLALAAFPAPAHADEFEDRVEAALEAPSTAEVVSRLEDEAYRGNLRASYELARMLREGKGVPRDDAAALDRLEEAATPNWIRARYKLGLAEAQYDLGIMLRDGIGAERDPVEAARWLERAADQGHGPAQLALATLYLEGLGDSEDDERAYFWASLAARADEDLREDASAIRERAGRRLDKTELRLLKRRIEGWSADLR